MLSLAGSMRPNGQQASVYQGRLTLLPSSYH